MLFNIHVHVHPIISKTLQHNKKDTNDTGKFHTKNVHDDIISPYMTCVGV